MDLPVFAMHQVLFPGHHTLLRVFEPRYRAMLQDVLPDGPLCIVAIRHGQEVGGTYDPYPVGVACSVQGAAEEDDGTYEVLIRADERVRLLECLGAEPYPVWRTEPYPEADEPEAGARVPAATGAAMRFLELAGDTEVLDRLTIDAEDPIGSSYALALVAPVLLPERQALLELPGPEERLSALTKTMRMEAGLLEALRRRGSGSNN